MRWRPAAIIGLASIGAAVGVRRWPSRCPSRRCGSCSRSCCSSRRADRLACAEGLIAVRVFGCALALACRRAERGGSLRRLDGARLGDLRPRSGTAGPARACSPRRRRVRRRRRLRVSGRRLRRRRALGRDERVRQRRHAADADAWSKVARSRSSAARSPRRASPAKRTRRRTRGGSGDAGTTASRDSSCSAGSRPGGEPADPARRLGLRDHARAPCRAGDEARARLPRLRDRARRHAHRRARRPAGRKRAPDRLRRGERAGRRTRTAAPGAVEPPPEPRRPRDPAAADHAAARHPAARRARLCLPRLRRVIVRRRHLRSVPR